ncbi:Argininosuccinate lyase (plasmid) [Variovorax sp. SRS16]|nr:Argininosuccinate lyase [Variovorax sp. SRS16]
MTHFFRNTTRMALLSLAAGLASLAHAGFPDRPIRIIAPAPPGGGIDILSRTIGQRMAVELGTPVIVDNRGGAGGTIGIEYAAKQPPDGYTLLMGFSGMAVNPHLNPKVLYSTKDDFAPLSLVGRIPMILVANPSFPPNTVSELVAYAKSQPGGLKYAHGGTGASSHLAGELFRITASVEVIPIAYKGNAPALVDVMAGHVPVMWDTINTAYPMVRAGKLKALAVATAQRLPALPRLPTLIEGGLPGFEVSAWYMLMAPKKTPVDVQEKLNVAIVKALKDPEVSRLLDEQGVQIVGDTREQATTFVNSQFDHWGAVIRKAGIKAD